MSICAYERKPSPARHPRSYTHTHPKQDQLRQENKELQELIEQNPEVIRLLDEKFQLNGKLRPTQTDLMIS